MHPLSKSSASTTFSFHSIGTCPQQPTRSLTSQTISILLKLAPSLRRLVPISSACCSCFPSLFYCEMKINKGEEYILLNFIKIDARIRNFSDVRANDCAFVVLSAIIKRSIARRKSRIGRVVYTPVGNGAPKVRTEPRVFCPSKSSLQNDTSESNINWSLMPSLGNLGFQFRAKTVDLFIDLKEKIVELYPYFEAPPVRSIRDFLMSARSEAMLPKPSRELVESYCELYNRARHDPGAYTDVDYLSVVVETDIPVVIDPTGKSSSLRVHKRRSKTCSLTRSGGQQDVVASSSEFIEMKIAGHGEAGPGSGVVVDGALRTALSRSGSAASDDSQTALIRLDHDIGGGGNLRTA
ncbi:hypothetical protein ACTXT7_010045 [Hymenolepis weldensis]